MSYYKGCGENEIFVGNHWAGASLKELDEGGVEYRLGDVAYDINGKVIAKDYMLPLFIAKKSLTKYDSIAMAELSRIRNL